MSVFVTDTHPLVWFTLNKKTNLSPKVRAVFGICRSRRVIHLCSGNRPLGNGFARTRRRIKLNNGFRHWAEKILSNSGFGLAPLEPEIVELGAGYNFNGDPFDETITAFAAHLDVPLITKDWAITNAGLVEIYW